MFKKGDKLRVVRAFRNVKVGDIVTCTGMFVSNGFDYVKTKEAGNVWDLDRFELHEAAPKPKKAPGKDNALVAYLRGKGLSRELARKAYNYLLNDVPRTNVADYIGRSLSEMFYFGDTKEGFDFWSRTNSKHFGNA